MPKIYPIGGGKGGVGKSFISASLGALIASHGKKVALIDLDLGASNLHTFLGLPAPENGLNRYLSRTTQQLESAAIPTHVSNLSFISSCHCSMEIANLFYAQKIKLINAIKKLPFDYVFMDLGAGTNFNTLDFFLTGSKGIFICTPEPTSIENAFRFIKAVYLRRLKQIIKKVAVGRRILPKAELLDEAAQCLRLLSGRNHRVYTAVCLVTPKESFRQRLVETRVRFKRLSEEDIEAYLASGEWRGKAGGYAAQGIAGAFMVKIVGSYSNVVGLPLYETMSLLDGEGYPIRFGWLNAV